MTMIVTPGNPIWLGMLALTMLLLAALSLALRGCSEKTRGWALSGIMTAVFILFWYYKWQISLDTDYAAIRAEAGIGTGTFSWWEELPLQLCNINIMLVPVALLTKKRPLLSFAALVGPLGALMALVMPTTGFSGYSLCIPRIWGYYVTHFMVVFGCLGIMALGFYRPKYSDIIPGILATLALSFVIFLVNMLMRATGVNTYANYFFNVDPEENPILLLTHSLIPVPYLYQLPLTLILAPYMLVMTALLRKRK